MAKQEIKSKKKSAEKKKQLSLSMPLQKENYLFIGIGVVVILLSYILLAMDNKADGFISLNIVPFMLIGGFVWIVYAIVYTPKRDVVEAVSGQVTER
jgi:hypothetical protein